MHKESTVFTIPDNAPAAGRKLAKATAELNKPLLPDIGVLAVVPDRWGPFWMSRHQVLVRLARYFHVIWVNPAKEWRKIAESADKPSKVETEGPKLPGFSVYEPEFWLPLVYRPSWLRRSLARARLMRARRQLTRRGAEKVILSLWTPEFGEALGLVPFDLSCYHIVDEYSYSCTESTPHEQEIRVLKDVDQVIVRSMRLLERKGPYNPNTVLIPNGVDYESFADQAPEPADLRSIPRPRIGYTGFLKKQLDWALLVTLAHQHPLWQFVFVGEQCTHAEIIPFVTELSTLPNAHFLGAKSTRELAPYAQHFDVCIMPYRVDGYTQNIYPLKLHEFLASGRPVAGSRIATLEMFSEVVSLADTPGEWSKAISSCLEPRANREEFRRARQRVAQEHDWELLTQKTARVLLQHFNPGVLKRFEEKISLNSRGE